MQIRGEQGMFYRQSTAEAAADLRGASARPVFAEPREFAEPDRKSVV